MLRRVRGCQGPQECGPKIQWCKGVSTWHVIQKLKPTSAQGTLQLTRGFVGAKETMPTRAPCIRSAHTVKITPACCPDDGNTVLTEEIRFRDLNRTPTALKLGSLSQ